MKLDSDEPYDTWKAQLLVRIDQNLLRDTIRFEDYDILFAIPRISPSPIALQSQEDYAVLLERTLKSRELSANVYVQERVGSKVPKCI